MPNVMSIERTAGYRRPCSDVYELAPFLVSVRPSSQESVASVLGSTMDRQVPGHYRLKPSVIQKPCKSERASERHMNDRAGTSTGQRSSILLVSESYLRNLTHPGGGKAYQGCQYGTLVKRKPSRSSSIVDVTDIPLCQRWCNIRLGPRDGTKKGLARKSAWFLLLLLVV